MGDVTPLYGGPSGEKKPDEATIKILEHWLEEAKAGQIVGIVLAGQSFDGVPSFQAAGHVGGFGLLGAIEAAKSTLAFTQMAFDDE